MSHLNIAYTASAAGELRFYFTIGAENASNDHLKEVNSKLKKIGLEVLAVNANYRKEFNLPDCYRGIAVFVQNHADGDGDFTRGTDRGADVKATYDRIRGAYSKTIVPAAADASQKMREFLGVVEKMKAPIGDEMWLELQPQLRGIEKVAAEFNGQQPSPSSSKDKEKSESLDRATAIKYRQDEVTTALRQVVEQIQSIEEMKTMLVGDKASQEALEGQLQELLVQKKGFEAQLN
jgi:hypothetical protein